MGWRWTLVRLSTWMFCDRRTSEANPNYRLTASKKIEWIK